MMNGIDWLPAQLYSYIVWTMGSTTDVDVNSYLLWKKNTAEIVADSNL